MILSYVVLLLFFEFLSFQLLKSTWFLYLLLLHSYGKSLNCLTLDLFYISVELLLAFPFSLFCYSTLLHTSTFNIVMSFNLHHFMVQIQVLRIINKSFIEITSYARQLLVRPPYFQRTLMLWYVSSCSSRCSGSFPNAYLYTLVVL